MNTLYMSTFSCKINLFVDIRIWIVDFKEGLLPDKAFNISNLLRARKASGKNFLTG